MNLRVLTWNLMHGRSVPGARRELLEEFGSTLAGWEWDVALLQEVPPWWPRSLGERTGASVRTVLTSRNSLLPLRRALGRRWPDAMKSNAGGCNAILVRSTAQVLEHRHRRLRLLPERRSVHAVKLSLGVWVANVHSSAAVSDAVRAAETLESWAGPMPFVLGGDFNVHGLALSGLTWAGGIDADHVFVRGLGVLGAHEVLEHGQLSDHAPVLVRVG